MKILIDTNICLDAILSRAPYVGNALEIVDLSQNGPLKGMLSAHSLDTIFYILRRKTTKTKAFKGIKVLRKAFETASVNQQVIDKAIRLKWNDFEDTIHYCAAMKSGCKANITRNENDFKHAELPVYSPLDFLEEFNN